MADLNHDIEKYLRGELTAPEMHALEKKALDDPFLANALEGIEGMPPADFADDIKQLRSQVAERIQDESSGKIVPMWPRIGRIAAGLLILVASGYIVLSLFDKKKPDTLALNKTLESESQPGPSLPAQTPVERSDASTNPGEKEPGLKIKEDPTSTSSTQYFDLHKPKEEDSKSYKITREDVEKVESRRAKEPVDDEIVETDKKNNLEEVEALKDVTLAAPIPQEKAQYHYEPSKSATLADTQPGVSISSEKKHAENKDVASKIVRGTVKDADDGSPLPGVNVMIKGSNAGVVTDAEGNYQIPLDDTNNELVFSFIGMQAIDVPVEGKENIDVKMEEDVSQLSEVVVVGYAAKSDGIEKEAEPNLYQLAEPAGGRKAFKKYLVDNLQYPEQAVENKIQGKVTIQFTVQQSGVIDDFKVLKGIGYGCDEEVIRLIRQGPKWSPTTRNSEPLKGKVKVRLRFQLPD